MTQDELVRLEALANAATSGPWYDNAIEWSAGNDGEQYPAYGLNPDNADADAALIAAARDAVPALVAEVKRLRGLVEAAFNEGQMSVDRDGYPEYGWDDSDALKALDGASDRPDVWDVSVENPRDY